jgi:hypothetical protein
MFRASCYTDDLFSLRFVALADWLVRETESKNFPIDAQWSQDVDSQNSPCQVVSFHWDAATNNAVSAVNVSGGWI